MDLAALTVKYHASLAEKRARIAGTAQQIAQLRQCDALACRFEEPIRQLIEDSHRVSGSAAMYGYEGIAAAAKALETRLVAIAAGTDKTDEAGRVAHSPDSIASPAVADEVTAKIESLLVAIDAVLSRES